MSQKIFKCEIGPFSISNGFAIVDLLYKEEYLSVACVDRTIAQLDKREKWFVEILAENPIDENEIRTLLRSYRRYSIKSDQLENIDWLKKCFENFKPSTIGNFYIFGPHLRANQRPANKAAIEIAAVTAFGTGEHPTTDRCLLACQTFFDHKIHRNALDIGCGSGILSIALAKLGAKHVTACDNDSEAVRITKENIAINRVAHKVSVFQNKAHEFDFEQYDFIVANILSAPLIKLSKYISDCLASNGILVLSGFNSNDYSVIRKYTELGLKQKFKYDYKNWTTVVWQKCSK